MTGVLPGQASEELRDCPFADPAACVSSSPVLFLFLSLHCSFDIGACCHCHSDVADASTARQPIRGRGSVRVLEQLRMAHGCASSRARSHASALLFGRVAGSVCSGFKHGVAPADSISSQRGSSHHNVALHAPRDRNFLAVPISQQP